MQIPIDKQVSFLNWQIKEHETAFKNYLNKQMAQHFKDKSAFVGKVWGIDEKRSSLIIRFPRGLAPRLKSPFVAFVFSGVPESENLDKWVFSYVFFRKTYIKAETDLSPIFYLKSQELDYTFIGCKDVEAGFFTSIQKLLKEGKKPSIVLAQKDPPVQYLLNLKEFIQDNPANEVLNTKIVRDIDEWNPKVVKSGDSKEIISNSLIISNEVIIQGPPGTGKSHLIAEIASEFLAADKSVCISALTNKALLEVAEKPGILRWIESGSVFKTNLTYDESNKLNKLKRAESLSIGGGELLLSTYYKLSDWFKKENSEAQKAIKPIYDLVIIEEASQSFLATIAAFKLLGRKVLIVGDPLQLPPIVVNENSAPSIHPNIMRFARGLETYAPNANNESFILIQSYRLSSDAARQTGIFYKNKLSSIQSERKDILCDEEFKKLIPQNGSSMVGFLPIVAEGDQPVDAISLTVSLVQNLINRNHGLEIAVLAPFKATVLALQEKLGEAVDDFSNLTIETIDRIQGLTVDFTVYLLALSNPSFAMDLNRFNVATSRSRAGTLIITDREYVRFIGIHPLVTKFLGSLETIII